MVVSRCFLKAYSALPLVSAAKMMAIVHIVLSDPALKKNIGSRAGSKRRNKTKNMLMGRLYSLGRFV